jgi:hypothetical protein
MPHFDKNLKMYAESGYRSAQDWLALGRKVESESKARSTITVHGAAIDLFTRDQTQSNRRSDRPQP